MLPPEEYYQNQQQHFNSLLAIAVKKINLYSSLRLWIAAGVLASALWAIRSGGNYQWWLAAFGLALFLIIVRIHHRLTEGREVLKLNLFLVEKELLSLKGDFSSFSDGAGYIDISHPFTYDLDIFGKGSVYQSLCRTVTIGGATLLASKLKDLAIIKSDITGRQEIIKELSTMPGFLQDFRVAGLIIEEGPKDQARITQWLEADDLFINDIIVKVFAVLMPSLTVAAIIWSIVIAGVCPYFTYVILGNWALMGTYSKKVKESTRQMGSSARLVDKYASLLAQVAGQEFKLEWLKKTGEDAKKMSVAILQFKKLVHLFEARSNGLTGPIMNTLFLFDFYCLLRLESWRKNHRQSLIEAMDMMIETDVLISSAVYAFNHPDYIYPTITDSGCVITASGLRHPLLSQKAAVGNDAILGEKEQFYLLTGANMTGKSTFIRTIGVSIVIGNAGLPFPAKALSLPLLDLYTSMRITDSVQEDISYFRAELNRVKMIMDKVKSAARPCLVLLDEPLRGTNSTDKQQGTRSIVETLLSYHAIGIVATHDTGLCDMELLHKGQVSNYHFESQVETGGLSFDFKLKPGGSTSNNATALMRQMGIIH